MERLGFLICGQMMEMYKHTIMVYLYKTGALRMPYFDAKIYFDENTRILNLLFYNIDYQLYDSFYCIILMQVDVSH